MTDIFTNDPLFSRTPQTLQWGASATIPQPQRFTPFWSQPPAITFSAADIPGAVPPLAPRAAPTAAAASTAANTAAGRSLGIPGASAFGGLPRWAQRGARGAAPIAGSLAGSFLAEALPEGRISNAVRQAGTLGGLGFAIGGPVGGLAGVGTGATLGAAPEVLAYNPTFGPLIQSTALGGNPVANFVQGAFNFLTGRGGEPEAAARPQREGEPAPGPEQDQVRDTFVNVLSSLGAPPEYVQRAFDSYNLSLQMNQQVDEEGNSVAPDPGTQGVIAQQTLQTAVTQWELEQQRAYEESRLAAVQAWLEPQLQAQAAQANAYAQNYADIASAAAGNISDPALRSAIQAQAGAYVADAAQQQTMAMQLALQLPQQQLAAVQEAYGNQVAQLEAAQQAQALGGGFMVSPIPGQPVTPGQLPSAFPGAPAAPAYDPLSSAVPGTPVPPGAPAQPPYSPLPGGVQPPLPIPPDQIPVSAQPPLPTAPPTTVPSIVAPPSAPPTLAVPDFENPNVPVNAQPPMLAPEPPPLAGPAQLQPLGPPAPSITTPPLAPTAPPAPVTAPGAPPPLPSPLPDAWEPARDLMLSLDTPEALSQWLGANTGLHPVLRAEAEQRLANMQPATQPATPPPLDSPEVFPDSANAVLAQLPENPSPTDFITQAMAMGFTGIQAEQMAAQIFGRPPEGRGVLG